MAIGVASTLGYMTTTKRIPAPEFKAFGRFLDDWVNREYQGNQTAAGKALKISQGHISALIRGERGPGLSMLLKMREKTGATIDSMLGFASMTGADELLERLRATFELEVARTNQKKAEAETALIDERAKQQKFRGKLGRSKAGGETR